MTILRLMAVFLAAVTVAGCAQMEQRRQHVQQLHMAALEGQCRSYGFTPQSDGFANCMMQVDQATQQQQAGSGAAMMAAGVALMNASQPRVLTPAPSLPVTTNCNRWANGQVTCISR